MPLTKVLEEVEQEKMQEAKILAGMFPKNVKVYAFFGKSELHIFDEAVLYKLSENFRRNRDNRRIFLSRVFEVRSADY